MSQLKTVAFLGAGVMGAPMAKNLGKAGFDVRLWNRSADKAEAASGDGVSAVSSIGQALSGAEVLITMLTDAASVNMVIDSCREQIEPGTIWVQMSTVGAKIDGLNEVADQLGVTLIDAPVLGTKAPAEQGQLIILASGDQQLEDKLAPLFGAMGSKTNWVSSKVGDSSRLKLALNSWVLALTHATAEALTIAKTLGVDPSLVPEILKGGPLDCGYLQLKSQAMLEGNFETNFSANNAAKDARLIREATEAQGQIMDLVVAGQNRFLRMIQAGHGEKDMAASFLAK
jgi:3-hydroxyisobutyrate dehydrogenase